MLPEFPLEKERVQSRSPLFLDLASSFLGKGVFSKPVAMTVMRTSSSSESSMPAPKMMLASLSAACITKLAASLISIMLISSPPVMLISTARAPSILVSSKGLEMAFLAASTMRFSPLPTPMPM